MEKQKEEVKQEVKKISWSEMSDAFYKFNLKNNNDDKKFMVGVVVYKKENFKPEYQSLEARSYRVQSNTWGFMPGKTGRCIIGRSLDGVDPCLRLDAQNWPVEYCYILENETRE